MAKRAHNEGTIYKKTVKRKGKTYTYWESQVTVGVDPVSGKRIRKTFTGSSQRIVKEKMQDVSVSVQKQEYFEPSKATLGEWIDVWLASYCNHVKYQTKKSYTAQCNTHIKPAIGSVPLCSLTTPHIQAFYNDLEKEGHSITKKNKKTGKMETVKVPLAPKSIKNIHVILSKCLNVAVRLKYIKFNPATPTSRPKVTRPEISPLTTDQIKEFLSALDHEDLADLYKVIVFTGLRKSEALGLSWSNIDFDSHVLRINQQLQKRPQRDGGYTIAPVKQDRVRFITVSSYVIKILTDRKAKQDSERETAGPTWTDFCLPSGKSAQLVFTNPDGTPVNPKKAYLHYNKIATQHNFDASRVHDLRHTFAVVSLQNGDDYKTIQENLGHASASFTLDIYGHRTTQMQKESASRMENFISTLNPDPDPQK